MSQAEVDLVIHGGTVVTHETRFAASIAIREGRIAAVGAASTMPTAADSLDASGLHILPGAIDVHVHFRDPGYTHKEDWATGSAAAACGGVTTVFDMPNVDPPTGTPEALALKMEAAQKSYVDFGVYGLLAEDNLEHLETLMDGGVIGFKCFMGNTFGNLPSPSTGAMLEGFEIIAKHGYRISLHAETASILAWRQAKLQAAGRTDPLAHLAARPAVAAVEAVSRAAVLAEWTGARIHVLHVSSAEELRPLRDAKARGVDITAETCPHYLYLNTDDYARVGSVIRVNPPVRTARDSDALWEALADGTVDMLATDHAPHNPEEKINEDIWHADCGFPGVETQMPLMLSGVNEGRLTLEQYVRLSAVSPAKAWGLFPVKGAIVPGADADLAIVDMTSERTVDQAAFHSERAHISPFHGRAMKGAPLHTLVRGRFVMRDGTLQEDARGHGRSVAPSQTMPSTAPRNVTHTIAAETGSRGGAS